MADDGWFMDIHPLLAMNHRVHSRVWIIVPQNDDLMVSTQKNAISRSRPGQKRGDFHVGIEDLGKK